jgi:hypothetical protein
LYRRTYVSRYVFSHGGAEAPGYVVSHLALRAMRRGPLSDEAERALLAQVMFYREASGGHTRIDAQFVVDRGQVCGDGTMADDELLGYLGIGHSLRDEAQHLYLAGGQSSRMVQRFTMVDNSDISPTRLTARETLLILA